MIRSRLVDLALACYPAWWRDRYGAEVRQVSDDLRFWGRSPVRITLDLLVGVFRVRRHARGMPMTYGLWNARTRVSVAAGTLPFVLLAPIVLACMGSSGLRAPGGRVFSSGVLYPTDLLQFGRDGMRAAPPLTPAASLVYAAEGAVLVVFLLAFVTTIYGWGSLIGAVRRAGPGRGRWIQLSSWTPGIVVLLVVALSVAIGRTAPHGYHDVPGHPPVPIGGDVTLFHLFEALQRATLIGGWLLSVVAIAIVTRRSEMQPFDLRTGRNVSLVMAACAVLLAGAYVAWGVGMMLQTDEAAHGSFTIVRFSQQGLWPVSTVALAVGGYLSVVGAASARTGTRIVARLSRPPAA